jgi:elongation factor P
MISTADFKRGLRIELDGDPWQIVDFTQQTASGRGSQTIIRARLKNIKTGQQVERAFRAGDRVKEPDFAIRPSTYSYEEGGETYYFMDTESYEQYPLKREDIESQLGFIRVNDEVRALVFNGQCIGIDVAQSVTLRVAETQPGFKGDTVNAATKPATLETGLVVQVPLFVETDELVVVDTRESRYVRRA